MALPILETPTYELVLPSSGKKIVYRPFLVKEFKVLLTTLESDESEVTRVLIDLIDNCTFKKLNVSELAHFDIEYIFINLRAKSIGEITELVYKCECEHSNNISINLLDVKIIKSDENFSNKIMIDDSVGVIMRYPRFNEMVDIYDNLKSEKIIELVAACIDKVFTKEEIFESKDSTKEELLTFVESFSKNQFEKLEKFFLSMPKVIHEMKHNCENCNKENEIVLEGLQNFFV